MARGLLLESSNLLKPRVVQRGELTGIVGMEFPLTNWLGAAEMRLLGDGYFAARLPVWLAILPLAFGVEHDWSE